MSNIIGTIRHGIYPDQNMHNGVVVYCTIKDDQHKWQYAYNRYEMRAVALIDTRKPICIIDHCFLSLPSGYRPSNNDTNQKMSYYVALYEDKTILIPELWATTYYSEIKHE